MKKKILTFLVVAAAGALCAVLMYYRYGRQEPLIVNVIGIEACRACDTSHITKMVQGNFPQAKIEFVDYASDTARYMIDRYDIKTLPAYIFNGPMESTPGYTQGTAFYRRVKDSYLLKSDFSGIFYYLDRPLIENRLDFFLDSADKNYADLRKEIDGIKKGSIKNISLHFVKDNEDILVKDLGVAGSPLVLVNNKYIFSFAPGSGASLEKFLAALSA